MLANSHTHNWWSFFWFWVPTPTQCTLLSTIQSWILLQSSLLCACLFLYHMVMLYYVVSINIFPWPLTASSLLADNMLLYISAVFFFQLSLNFGTNFGVCNLPPHILCTLASYVHYKQTVHSVGIFLWHCMHLFYVSKKVFLIGCCRYANTHTHICCYKMIVYT